MKSMVSAAALGLLFALASMTAQAHAAAGEDMDGAISGGDAIFPSARDNGDQKQNAHNQDAMSNPPRDEQLMNGISREFSKDNKTIRIN